MTAAPEFRHRHAKLTERHAGLLPRAQVRRQIRARVAKTAEINYPRHARGLCRGGTVSCRYHIELRKVAALAEAVDEIIHHVHVAHGVSKRIGIQEVTLYHLYAGEPRTALKSREIPHQAAHPMPGLDQTWHQSSSDMPVAPVTRTVREDCGAIGINSQLIDL
jgi:hypothetical protein